MSLLNCKKLIDVVSIQCPGLTTVCEEWRQTLIVDFQLCRECEVVRVEDTFTEPSVCTSHSLYTCDEFGIH